MELFLCWSGAKSRKLALFLSHWIPSVLQAVEPWMSDNDDIDKGSRWQEEIAEKLDRVDFAVVCLAGTNQVAPWVNFESGAVSKLGGRVATVCLDLRKADVQRPLAMFNGTDLADRDDVERLMLSINAACRDRALETERVKSYFDRDWPQLLTKVQELRALVDEDEPVDFLQDAVQVRPGVLLAGEAALGVLTAPPGRRIRGEPVAGPRLASFDGRASLTLGAVVH